MFKCLFRISILCHFLVASFNAVAITPTLNLVQKINFGNLILSTGSCRMLPDNGVLTNFQGTFLCGLPGDSKVGKYTIIANPNSQVQVKVLPNLDNGDGYSFNPRVYLLSDVGQKVIVDNTEFVEINSGISGIINIDIGGDLTVYSLLPAGQTFNFTYDPGIEWNEL